MYKINFSPFSISIDRFPIFRKVKAKSFLKRILLLFSRLAVLKDSKVAA